MGDRRNPRTMSFLLPPGCRFHPSDDQLLRDYLTNKNSDDSDDFNDYNLIKELDLYDYDPFDLPDNVCFAYGCGGRRRHWFCYTKGRVLKERRGGMKRKAKGGHWRRSGKVRDVVGPGGNSVVGTRTKFVYYLGNSPASAVRTNWVLYEYALLDHVKASFVLCRVFVKSRVGEHSVSENVFSSCAEESVSAVRHVGIQHDQFLTPDILETKVRSEGSVDRRDDLSRYPVRLISKLDDQQSKQVTSDLIGDNTFISAKTNEQLLSILEEDFIELDDLVD